MVLLFNTYKLYNYRRDSIELIAKYMRGYLDFVRYGRMNRVRATNKYFDNLRAKIEFQAALKIK